MRLGDLFARHAGGDILAGLASILPWGQHPRVQILTVGEILAGKKLDAPPPRQTSLTYKRAPKALKKAGKQAGMFGDG